MGDGNGFDGVCGLVYALELFGKGFGERPGHRGAAFLIEKLYHNGSSYDCVSLDNLFMPLKKGIVRYENGFL